MIYFFLTGTLLGLTAGIAPGPLLTLVVSETLQHNVRSGIRVALAPLVTDLPIILLSVLLLAKLADFNGALGVLSLGGALFLLLLGTQNLCQAVPVQHFSDDSSRSLGKGILVNFLSPHPYLFWISVGTPLMLRAYGQSLEAAVVFICAFYGCLIGSKIVLAVLVERSRQFLVGPIYLAAIRGLGLILLILAFMLFYDGLNLLGVFA
jgi:threonine/homoserine/homoserine lactone efflux protein